MESRKKNLNLSSNVFIKNPFTNNENESDLRSGVKSSRISGNISYLENNIITNTSNRLGSSSNIIQNNTINIRTISKQPKQSQFSNLTNSISNGFKSDTNNDNIITSLKEKEKEKDLSKLPSTTKNKPIKLIEPTIKINNIQNISNNSPIKPNNKKSFNQIYSNAMIDKNKDKDSPKVKKGSYLENLLKSNKLKEEEVKEKNNDYQTNIAEGKKLMQQVNRNALSSNSNKNTYSSIQMEKINSTNKFETTHKNFGKSIYSTKNKKGSKNFNLDKNRSNSVKMSNNPIDVMSLMNNNHQPINLSVHSLNFPFFEASKTSLKSCTPISAYAANTHQGSIRNYNEDRVSIILNIVKPTSFKGGYWPKCSFFAVYDGHGGFGCADFLRDNLHQMIIKDSNFPHSPKDAILNGCSQAEEEFTKKYALNSNESDINDRSGSCAVFSLIVDDVCYIGNVGDSRAVLSKYQGSEVIGITRDHKPNDDNESKRIYSNGGRVYQTQTSAAAFSFYNSSFKFNQSPEQIFTGPSRVFPGRLSVSRTFGDIEAKLTKFGGLPNVITAIPELFSFKITAETDFIFLGCDGIFDLFKNEEIGQAVFMSLPIEAELSKNNSQFPSINQSSKDNSLTIHSLCGKSVDLILKTALHRNCLDNVTSVLVAFNGLEEKLKQVTGSNMNDVVIPSSIIPNSKENEITQSSMNKYLSSTERKWKTTKEKNNSIIPPITDNKFRQSNIEKAYKSIYANSLNYDYKTTQSSISYSNGFGNKKF